eukprot:36819_1
MAQKPIDQTGQFCYAIEVEKVALDPATVTAKEVKNKQFAASYTTGIYDSPGSLTAGSAAHFEIKNGVLLWITLDVSAPAKNTEDKNKIDPTNSYKATAKTK